jgi:hypothetical protein
MNSSGIITLFADPPPSRRGPSSFMVSILLHGAGISLFYLGLRHTPRVVDPSLTERFTVRLLKLQRTEQQATLPAQSGVQYPVPQAAVHPVQPGGRMAGSPYVPRQFAQLVRGPQTLVQPDLPPKLLLPQEIPIPAALMWSPENAPTRQIAPPPPQEVAATNVQPSLEIPNREATLADLNISATAFTADAPLPSPSTTSPVAVLRTEPAKAVPEPASKPVVPPSPARVLSISDLQMREGTITLPPANESAPASSSGLLAPGNAKDTSEAGNRKSASEQNGSGAGQGAGDQTDKAAAAGASVGQTGGATGQNQGSDEPGAGADLAFHHITVPRDGRFGAVVVGSSLAEEYPEMSGLWSGRLAYTVYLHVGLAKNWILQYSLPRAAEAAAAGNTIRPEAPWPYDIVRPQLAPGDFNADAIMVHGFVNVAGRFEQLAIVFPPQFAQTKFVLGALQQWQFRPAMQNGQIAAVEVLLIIPDELE